MAATDIDDSAKKSSRAGRDLPAAIAVGVALGGGLIAILLFAPYVWIPVVAAAIAVATHEVVGRLRDGGYSIPLLPLLIDGYAPWSSMNSWATRSR